MRAASTLIHKGIYTTGSFFQFQFFAASTLMNKGIYTHS